MEMEMVAGESIGVGEDLTPPLSPIAYSLHDSFLSSHCASCFSPLLLTTTNPNLNYCSPSCSSSHSPLHISSGAHLLSKHSSSLQTSDLRVALLLLLQIKPFKSYNRICGLMSNRHNLLTTSDNDLSTRIKNGARSMAMAVGTSDDGFLLEEAVLCVVLTNAVEVQDHRNGQSVGIAVYDTCFSWINHSCSPNACYRFLPPETPTADQRCLIVPSSSKPLEPSTNFDLLTGSAGGPRIVVRSIKMIQKGEEVTIAYTDLLQPKELRQSDLWSKYRFTCCCQRCVALPLTCVDQCLQGSNDLFTEYIEDAIDDYLSYNDAESCCKKLEDALLNHEIRLHPQNHLCLNAYTTLASAYSSASIIIAVEDIDGYVLKMKRFSAAYSLLLSLLTHDLFLHESSLIASVSNYWISAGESLINLAKCLGEPLSRCGCECDMLASKEQVFKCMSGIIRGGKVWKFLVAGNGYLKVVKDPMDLSWFKDLVASDSESDCLEGEQVYGLGVHCLLYGGVLSKISGHHLSCYNMNLLHL